MARRKRRKVASSGSLDSFLDIVTNSLGLLILVALLSAFSAQGVKISLGTPIMTDADVEMEVIQFQVVEGRILPIDLEFCESQLIDFFSTGANQHALAAQYNANPPSNEFHSVLFEAGEAGLFGIGGTYEIRPVSDEVGDTVEDLDDPSSEFLTRIEQLDADRQWVFFLVSSDSFEQFREFREYVKLQGFEVGWIPYKAGEPVLFGPGGRSARIG